MFCMDIVSKYNPKIIENVIKLINIDLKINARKINEISFNTQNKPKMRKKLNQPNSNYTYSRIILIALKK